MLVTNIARRKLEAKKIRKVLTRDNKQTNHWIIFHAIYDYVINQFCIIHLPARRKQSIIFKK